METVNVRYMKFGGMRLLVALIDVKETKDGRMQQRGANVHRDITGWMECVAVVHMGVDLSQFLANVLVFVQTTNN